MDETVSVTISVRDVDKEDHKQLRLFCVEHELSLNALMLQLIRDFLAEQAKKQSK